VSCFCLHFSSKLQADGLIQPIRLYELLSQIGYRTVVLKYKCNPRMDCVPCVNSACTTIPANSHNQDTGFAHIRKCKGILELQSG
jgi:hypothetical protein